MKSKTTTIEKSVKRAPTEVEVDAEVVAPEAAEATSEEATEMIDLRPKAAEVEVENVKERSIKKMTMTDTTTLSLSTPSKEREITRRKIWLSMRATILTLLEY